MIAAWVAAWTAGCADEGTVSLRFDLPDEPGLRPSGAATITLVARVGDNEPRATTASIGSGADIDLGSLPVRDDVWLSAELRSAQAQLVGFGQARGPIEVRPEAAVEAVIPVRRPFVYLAGAGARVVTLDASVRGAGYQGQIAAPGTPVVIADVAGTDVATITAAGELSFVATDTHGASSLPALQLAPAPADAIASPDGRYLVVGHGGASPRVTVVDIATGQTATGAVPEPADRVAVTRAADGTWWGVALLRRAPVDPGCPPSRLATFPLASPQSPTIVEPGLGLSDVAGDARTGMVAVADRCGSRVLRFDPTTGGLDETTPLVTLPSPTAVAAIDGQLWVVGHDRETGAVPDGVIDAWLVLGSIDRAGNVEVVELAPVIERVLATTVDAPDQDLTRDLHANLVVADDLVILPGGAHLGLTLRVVLRGGAYVNGAGDVVIPTLDMTTREYWLVDASTRLPSQRVRTSCNLVVGSCDFFSCLLRTWACLPDIDGPGAVGEFAPTAMAALFGAR
jgi:hypothetical protein